ncbi:MAG TPA: hypothetical protein VFV63_12430, partial [Ilumatobacteraceae bacterium]|nr:hypothetical protein [Ilumatobacteraceae bacterium]
MGDETPVLDAPERAPTDTPSRFESHPEAAPTVGATLLEVQRRAGNRAAIALADRMVQRDPAGPGQPAHTHPHADSGGGSVDTTPAPEFEEYIPRSDVIEEINALGSIFEQVAGLHWDEDGERQGLPADLFRPSNALLVTQNKRIVCDRFGNPLTMEDNSTPIGSPGWAMLLQVTSGRLWQLMHADGVIRRALPAGTGGPLQGDYEASTSALIFRMPDAE